MKPYGVTREESKAATDTANSGIGVQATGHRANQGGKSHRPRTDSTKAIIRAAKKVARRWNEEI